MTLGFRNNKRKSNSKKKMEMFEYDLDDSYENNFSRWWHMNSLEREMWNEARLEKEAAEDMFRGLAPKFVMARRQMAKFNPFTIGKR
jgi:hypothetical protein